MRKALISCSECCERKNECGRYVVNLKDQDLHQVGNLYFCGSTTTSIISGDKTEYKETYWCGERGNWGMFMDMENN